MIVMLQSCDKQLGTAVGDRSGEKIYQTYCFACHDRGAAGAIKLSDRTALSLLSDKGMDALLISSKAGVGAMPAKGSCLDCTDDELSRSIQYLLRSGDSIEK